MEIQFFFLNKRNYYLTVLHEAYIKDWQKDEDTFLETKAAIAVKEPICSRNIVVVTGSSGTGKSSKIHHLV